MKRTLSIVGAAFTVAALFLPASPADAAFPGANGDIVFAGSHTGPVRHLDRRRGWHRH